MKFISVYEGTDCTECDGGEVQISSDIFVSCPKCDSGILYSKIGFVAITKSMPERVTLGREHIVAQKQNLLRLSGAERQRHPVIGPIRIQA